MFSSKKMHPPAGRPGRITKVITDQQRKAADYLNAKAAHWGTKGKTAFLVLTALGFCIAYALILLDAPKTAPVRKTTARPVFLMQPPGTNPLPPPVKDSSKTHFSLKTPRIQ